MPFSPACVDNHTRQSSPGSLDNRCPRQHPRLRSVTEHHESHGLSPLARSSGHRPPGSRLCSSCLLCRPCTASRALRTGGVVCAIPDLRAVGSALLRQTAESR